MELRPSDRLTGSYSGPSPIRGSSLRLVVGVVCALQLVQIVPAPTVMAPSIQDAEASIAEDDVVSGRARDWAPGVSVPMLTRLAKGGRIGVDLMVSVTAWLGNCIAVFT